MKIVAWMPLGGIGLCYACQLFLRHHKRVGVFLGVALGYTITLRSPAAAMTILLLCFFLGCVTGLRSMMAPAVVCWGAHFGWLNFAGTKLSFINTPAALIIVTLLALGELVADKLPRTPARTVPLGLIPRIVLGCLCAVALSISVVGNFLAAATLGIAGALTGTYGGYNIRKALVSRAHLPDLAVALAEDAIAIAGGLFIVSHV